MANNRGINVMDCNNMTKPPQIYIEAFYNTKTYIYIYKSWISKCNIQTATTSNSD